MQEKVDQPLYLLPVICTKIIPAFILACFLAALYTQPDMRLPRLILFILSVSLTLRSPRLGALFVISSCIWFEVPNNVLGYTNQFLSDVSILGFICVMAFGQQKQDAIPDIRLKSLELIRHPFFIPLFFIIPLGIFASLASFYELYQIAPSGLSIKRTISEFTRGAFVWGIAWNPFHSQSVLIGYALQISFLATLTFDNQRLKLNCHDIIKAIYIGSIPVFLLTLCQIIFPNTLTSAEPSGTFQSGNHLSFYCGLLLLMLPYFYSVSAMKWQTICIGILAFIGLLAGQGKLGWLALLSCVAIASTRLPKKIWKNPISNKRFPITIFIIASILISIAAFYLFQALDLGNTRDTREIIAFLKNPSFQKLFNFGGRLKHLNKAIELTYDYPLFGIGLDNFFQKANLSIEIHNWFLKWIVGFGWLSMLPYLIASLLFFPNLITPMFKKDFRAATGALILIYFILCSLGDVYFSYRSLLALSTFLIWYFYHQTLVHPSFSSKQIKTLLLLLTLVGSSIGAASILHPHTRPMLIKSYHLEPNEEVLGGKFQWHSMAMIAHWKSNKRCISLQAKPVHPGLAVQFTAAILSSPLDLSVSYSSLKAIENTMEYKTSFSIPADQWTPLCVCRKNADAGNWFYLRSHTGEYLSFSSHKFGIDRRFIGWGSTPAIFTDEKDARRCASPQYF